MSDLFTETSLYSFFNDKNNKLSIPFKQMTYQEIAYIILYPMMLVYSGITEYRKTMI